MRGDRIVAVGTTADCRPSSGPKTRVLDLAGRTVVPGFEDAPRALARASASRASTWTSWGRAATPRWSSGWRRPCKTRAPGEWVRGRGWHEEQVGRRRRRGPCAASRPTTRSRAVSPDNPVVLERADGHAVLANAKAMAPYGDHARDAGPRGRRDHPRRERRADRRLRRQRGGARRRRPSARADELRRALELAMDECLAKGVTSLTDAGAGTDVIALYREARRRREAAHAALRDGARACRRCGRSAGRRPASAAACSTVRAVKLYADGALGSRGRGAPRALRRRSRQPRACSSPRPRGSSRRRASPSPTASRSAPTPSATAPTASCSTPTRRPSRERPEVKDPRFRDRARADPRRRRHPALRPARRARLDAGDPLPLRPALGPEAPRRRPRRRGRLRLAQAPRRGRAHPQRHRRAGRGRLADPELPRHGDARRRPTASRRAASTPTRS